MSGFLLLFGLIFMWIGGMVVYDYYTVVTTYETIPGKVKAFRMQQRRSRNSNSLMYYPIIEYVAYGNEKELKANSGASWPMYDIGESVEVYYSRKIDEARLKSITQSVIGSIFFLIGLGICYYFWSNFEITFFSLLFTLGPAVLLAWFLGSLMRKNNITSMPEISHKIRNLRKKSAQKDQDDDASLITEQSDLMSTDLPGNKNIKVVGPIFALVGLLAIAMAMYLGLQRWNFLERALPVEGTVIEYYASTDSDGTTYYPVVEFKSPESGRAVTFRHDVGSSHPSYSRGALVPVLYDPDNNYEAIIDEDLWNWFGTILISVLGFAFLGMGITMIRRWLKIERFKKKAYTH
mgnify:CR=1 FL=1